ncbi:MAG: type II toxin-antitoxin system RelE/ParE family toxin [Cyanothece sp. SIO2G6]|nr:type II toxin-antitoxin system RelE/ParE family toxin [Cyanothece sp. SIO2G6]
MQVVFHPSAQLELNDTTTYYDSISRKLGDNFVDAVDRTLSRITQFPDAWTSMPLNARRSRVDGFPYGVVYRINDDCIQVLAIMHLQRQPNYWTERG